MDKFFLGMDVGTSGCKAVVFNENGQIHGYDYKEYPVICDEPFKAEQDALYVFESLLDVTKKAVAQSGTTQIEAMAVSVQGDATMPVDKNFKPLHNMLLGMDYRTTEECAFLEREIGKTVAFQKTGMPIHPINTIAKILWFKYNKPKVSENAFKFMTYSDYITAQLCGEAIIDITMASRTMMMDIQKQCWDRDILGLCGIREEQLSRIMPSGRACGVLKDTLKNAFGLKNNPVVVTGGHDQTCGGIGAGMIREGIAVDSSGTAEVFSTTFQKPILNDKMLDSFYPCYSHAAEGMYFTFALNHTAGIVLRWYRDQFAQAETIRAKQLDIDVYDYMQKNIENKPSDIFVLPHFNGSGTPACDMNSKGAFLGLTLSTLKKDVLKGLFDGLTYELRINMEAFLDAGLDIQEIRAVGGGAKSDLWIKTKADILCRPVTTLRCKEAGCLGAACLATVGCGNYSNIMQAVSKMVKTDRTYEPNIANHKRYMDKYGVYKDLYWTLKPINSKI